MRNISFDFDANTKTWSGFRKNIIFHKLFRCGRTAQVIIENLYLSTWKNEKQRETVQTVETNAVARKNFQGRRKLFGSILKIFVLIDQICILDYALIHILLTYKSGQRAMRHCWIKFDSNLQ